MIGQWAGAYGWSSDYPLSALTVSATAARRGLDNRPAFDAHLRNLSILSDFLGRLPFRGTVTSGYRSPAVNAAVGGSATSQHPNGLAVDIVPSGMTNRDAAGLLHENRHAFPELDQVIWYSDTNHVHIGVCPPGGVGCVSSTPRGLFLQAQKEGASYATWAPEIAVQAASQALQIVSVAQQQHRRRPWVVPTVLGATGLLVAGVVVAFGR